jgi:ELWxxDGT repeat protein
MLYFTADDGVGKYPLYKSNGTEAGTVKMDDGLRAPYNVTNDLEVAGNYLYFQRDDGKLYVTDGTTVKKVVNGAVELEGLFGSETISNVFYFSSKEGVNFKFYKISGGMEKAVEIKDADGVASINNLCGLDHLGTTPYILRDALGARSLWKINTTTNKAEDTGVAGVEDIHGFVGAYLFYVVNNAGDHELWQFNSTTKAASRVKSANNVDMFACDDGGDAIRGETFGTNYYFTSADNVLWQTNGTPAGTIPVIDAKGRVFSPINEQYGPMGTYMLIYYNDGIHGSEFWQTAGTPATTFMGKEINPNGNATMYGGEIFSGKFYTIVDDGRHGLELWLK